MDLIAFGIIVGVLIWLAVLIYHLRRTDCTDTDKIIWVIVLCLLNILGALLYVFLGPKSDDDDGRVLSEQELKDKFNQGTK